MFAMFTFQLTSTPASHVASLISNFKILMKPKKPRVNSIDRFSLATNSCMSISPRVIEKLLVK